MRLPVGNRQVLLPATRPDPALQPRPAGRIEAQPLRIQTRRLRPLRGNSAGRRTFQSPTGQDKTATSPCPTTNARTRGLPPTEDSPNSFERNSASATAIS